MREPLVTDKEMKIYEKERKLLVEKAEKAYSYGINKAEKSVISCHPVRLAISLSYSVFTYDII